jgi:RNA polymerase sigma-70 factor (ECF subfamily)
VTDADLIARARAGDTAAFGELVDRHRPAVLRAAMAALGRHDEAEDVAQVAFIKAHRSLGTFRGDSSFRTWVVAITWRTAASRRRSLARWWRGGTVGAWEGESGDAAADPPAPDRSPEASVIDAEFAAAVRDLVRSLPARWRDPLLLGASGEYSMHDIAVMLGAPEGTVKWRISEARRMLRTKLERLGFGSGDRR